MRSKNRKFKRMRVVGVAVGLMAGLTAGELAAEPVNAANGWDIDLNAGSDIQEASSVTITIGSGTNVMLIPKNSDKAAGIIKRTASVEIGATNGYTIKVSGNSDLMGNNANNKIPSVSSATTLQQMNNQWGWYNAEGDVNCSEASTFRAMTSAGELVASGSLDSKTTKQITMCFGAKVNTSQAADNYSNSVVISAVAQPRDLTVFGGVKTMQDMTPSICKAASENDTAYLQDTRDGKSYWVTKLADGNCWMSQNLVLDLSTSKLLTSADSDVVGSWTPEHDTISGSWGGGTASTDNYSWNLGGNYLLYDPTPTEVCNPSGGIDECAGRYSSVGSRKASMDPNFYKNNGNKTYTDTEYDAHYLVGNRYQWNAATAGTGGAITNANAAGSICPKNWKLPNSNSVAKNSFGYLLQQYGVSSSASGTTSVNGNAYKIALSPLFFVNGSSVDPSDDWLPFAPGNGTYWSSRAYSDASQAYYLKFNNSTVNSSASSSRYFGYAVRCLVPTT